MPQAITQLDDEEFVTGVGRRLFIFIVGNGLGVRLGGEPPT